jgi:TetR/AcrR family transcriptional regulator, tetracycline repressor protein
MTSKPPLSKAAVVERVLKLADADGLEALTIRKLATDLGVTPMALYWHFRSKEELLNGVAEHVWGEIDVNVDSSAPWSAQLRGILESLVSVLRSHPSAALLLGSHAKQVPAAFRAIEVTLAVLRDGAGFDPEHASEIARNALYTGIMLVMSEVGFDLKVAEADRDEEMRTRRVKLAMLPPKEYPNLVECAIPMTACDDPEFHYRLGVDLFIAGVEALARQSE